MSKYGKAPNSTNLNPLLHNTIKSSIRLSDKIGTNIDLEGLQLAHPYDDVESLLELMVDVLCSTAPTMRGAGCLLYTSDAADEFLGV